QLVQLFTREAPGSCEVDEKWTLLVQRFLSGYSVIERLPREGFRGSLDSSNQQEAGSANRKHAQPLQETSRVARLCEITVHRTNQQPQQRYTNSHGKEKWAWLR